MPARSTSTLKRSRGALSNWNTIIVVPCYNEAARLNSSAFSEFARCNPDTKILFVDDCSADDTLNVLRSIESEIGRQIRIVSLVKNKGKGEAVRVGMNAAFEEAPLYAGFWDADLATPLEAVPLFREVLKERADVLVVLGSRVRLLGRTIERSPLRHYVGRVFATAASLSVNLPVYDTQCGAKLLRVVSTVKKLFSEPFVSRWAFDVEIIARLLDSERRISNEERTRSFYELPLSRWEDVAGSKVRMTDFPRSLVDLMRIRRRYPRASS